MRVEKPRLFQGTRDIVLSIGLLLVIMVFTVGFTGMCSFNPGTPDGGPVNEVDQHTILSMDARGLPFPVRDPAMPEGWQANSARRVQLDGQPSSLVGWVIDGRDYVSLRQTGAELEPAVKDVDGEAREETGSEEVGGVRWRTFTSPEDGVRPVWAADLGGSRALLEGMASDGEMRAAAGAVAAAEPLPSGDAARR